MPPYGLASCHVCRLLGDAMALGKVTTTVILNIGSAAVVFFGRKINDVT